MIEQLSSLAALETLRAVGSAFGGVLGDHAGDQWVLMFETLRDTGRRPKEICSLRLDCLDRDSDGRPVLVWDNHKGRRHGRRLPISDDLHEKLLAQQAWVVARFPTTPRSRLRLFPRPRQNIDGSRYLASEALSGKLTDWITRLDRIDGPDRGPDGEPVPFPRHEIYPYAFRHAFAQRHADAGTSVDVLQVLMDHDDIKTTQIYYRITAKRKRAAADRVDSMRRSATGKPRLPDIRSEAALVRDAVGQVAVPFGLCAEPVNVQAGGQQCPIRRCMGCGYFTSDPSFLPDLKAHLDDLGRARERGIALGADEWALVPAEELARLRELIGHLETDLAALPDDERHLVERACEQLRTARRTVPITIGRRSP